MIPGFDFLQNMAKGASGAMPSLGSWVSPTLDPEEIAKRIEELKTVQFWLEQNARMIATTVQALEVQRMTLSTLQSMNVQMGDLGKAFRIEVPEASPAPAAPPAPAAAANAARPRRARKGTGRPDGASGTHGPAASAGSQTAAPGKGVVDPMQWWGALSQQFSQLAAKALRETAAASGTPAAAAPAAQSPASSSAAPASAGRRKAAAASRDSRAASASAPEAGRRRR